MNRVQTLRSSTPGARPSSRAPGELFVNFPDRQLGVIDSASAPLDLIAVRFFSAGANYAVGDCVMQGGKVYQASAAITPGAFNPAQWTALSTAADLASVDTQIRTDFAAADAATLNSSKSYADAHDTTTLNSAKSYADAGDTATLGSAKGYADGKFLPLAGGTITGALTVNGATTFAGNPVKFSLPAGASSANYPVIDAPAGTARVLVGSTAGSPRWRVVIGNGATESGANAGSDFAFSSYDDSGALLTNPLLINRANSAVNITGVGGAPYSGTAGVSVGAAALFLNKAAGTNGLQVSGTTNGSLRWQLILGDSSAETGGNQGSIFSLNRFSDSGANLGVVMSAGRVGGTVTFTVPIVNGSSDRRLKENVEPIDGALDKVNALSGVSFNMIATPEKREIGLIAQDVEPVVPEVMQEYETTDGEGNIIGPYLSLDYPKLTALLIEALKELTARVVQLEAKGT